MAEKPSNTSNHQRLEEMMCHLTPEKAVVPYNICFDLENNIWVASKGGLFKFDPAGKELLFCLRNDFPKKVAPYAQVLLYKTKIIYTTCDDKALTEFRILRSADGTVEHQHFVDGKIQSLAVTEEGDLFMTKQTTADAEESVIWRSHIDSPVGWEEFYSDFEQTFQAICAFDNNTLAVAAVSMPVNIYSKQCLKWLDTTSCRPSGNNFASAGKGEGQIYFPRCMRSWDNALLVMDKTGRIQKFSRAGQFERVAAKIDDYIGNGFTVRGDEAVIACSGIVLDKNGESICDDWIEAIRLDGSKWTNTIRN